MKYTKKLLGRENRDYSDELFYGSLFEMLNNEKTLEEYASKIITKLDGISGNVYVVKRNGQTVEILNEYEEGMESRFLESEVYKKIKETKKTYFRHNCESEDGDFYAGFPLNLKGKFVGGLIVEEKQDIKQWKEIFVALHMLVFGFRYFALIEKERNMNIRDIITGLYNEKYFYHQFEGEESKFVRFKDPLTLVLINFENYNKITDDYGYEISEKVLKYIANTIKKQSRLYDMPARVERGLFGILLSKTKEEGGEAIVNRVKSFVGDIVEIDGKEIEVEIKFSYGEFKNHHSRETFFKEVYDNLN